MRWTGGSGMVFKLLEPPEQHSQRRGFGRALSNVYNVVLCGGPPQAVDTSRHSRPVRSSYGLEGWAADGTCGLRSLYSPQASATATTARCKVASGSAMPGKP
jgi:hypothetical protein